MRQAATWPSLRSQAARTRTWEAAFPGTADQISQVRAALRVLLRDCPIADDVTLLVSELCANACLHSDSREPGGTFTVRIQHHRGEYIRAEVQDQGSAWNGDLSGSARHPHGLYIVTAVSSACGVRHGAGRSRIVWFRLDYPTERSRAMGPSSPHYDAGYESQVLHGIAGQLAASRLEITESVSSDGVTELTVTNPAQPSRGRVRVGYEGYVILEYRARGDADACAAEITDAVTALLATGPST